MIPLRAYVDLVRQQFAEMQRLAGASAEWVLDAAGAMTPGDAASVAVALERAHPIWFDEPTLVTTQDALAKIVNESTMPIGIGRHITDMPAFQGLLAGGSVNIALKFQLPDLLECVETNAKIRRAVAHMEMLREGLGPDLDFAVDFHARPSPTVAAIILREIEPLHLLFAEEICPPENVRAMARAVRHSTTPIATGERLIASFGYAELIDMGVVDVLQPDIAQQTGRRTYTKVIRKIAAG